MARLGWTGVALALLGGALIAAASGSAATMGEWRTLAPSPLERTEVGAGRIGDGIYVVGGFTPDRTSTGKMARYDISEDSWRLVEPLPVAANHPGVAAYRRHLFVLGGFRDDFSARGDFFRYHPDRDPEDRWERLPDSPIARGALVLAGRGGRIYAAGGSSGSSGSSGELRDLHVYDIKERTWTEARRMPTGRNHVAGEFVDGRLFVTGGRTDEGLNLDVVERYDPTRDRWKRLPPLATARSGHAVAALPAGLAVFGGEQLSEGTETIAAAELLDPATGDSETLTPMATPRHGLGGAARRGIVYAAEGGTSPGFAFSSALESLTVSP